MKVSETQVDQPGYWVFGSKSLVLRPEDDKSFLLFVLTLMVILIVFFDKTTYMSTTGFSFIRVVEKVSGGAERCEDRKNIHTHIQEFRKLLHG